MKCGDFKLCQWSVDVRLDGGMAEDEGSSSASRERLPRGPSGAPLLAADMFGRSGELEV